LKYQKNIFLLILVLITVWIFNISLGSVSIPFSETIKYLVGKTLENDTWQTILHQIRIPKSLTAIIVGSGLSIAGLVMQTLFRNPMAGPSVLGISAGASLGVALLIMGSGLIGFVEPDSIGFKISSVLSAIFGSLLVLILILLLSIRIKNSVSILIIGLMLSALTTSIVSILSFYSTAQKLQQYLFWGFGNLGNLDYTSLFLLAMVVGVAIISIIPQLKQMNSMMLGENFAKSLGINVNFLKKYLLLITGIIIGILTAFVGPIAFIGLATPHLARLIFKTSDHKILFPSVLLIGSIVMLVCDTIAQLPFNDQVIPINAVTSLIGAPIVIFLVLKQKKYQI